MKPRSERPGTREEGIVLALTKFGERQMVVHLLTPTRSRAGYVASVGRGAESRRLFAPLSIVEFTAVYGRGELGKMRDAAASPALYNINGDPIKCTVALFVSELLYRVVRTEGEAEQDLYGFVREAVEALDAMEDRQSVANFHLWFMVRLAGALGYAPRDNWTEGWWFDIKLGEFVRDRPLHALCMEPECAGLLARLMSSDGQTGDWGLNGGLRREFLGAMTDYYAWHTEAIYSVRSLAILSEIFN